MRPLPLPHQCMLSVQPQRDNILPHLPAARRCGLPVLPQQGKQPSISNADRGGHEPFPKPAPTVLSMSRLAEAKSSWQGTLVNSVSDLMHHQYRLSVPQWNPGPARKNPTHILAAPAGDFTRLSFKKPGTTSGESRTNSSRTPKATTSPSCSTQDTFEPDAAVSISEASSSKDTRRMAALVLRGLLRRPSHFRLSERSRFAQSTFTTKWPRTRDTWYSTTLTSSGVTST